MPDNPLEVKGTYSLEDMDWQNAFGAPDGRPAHLLRQDALSEIDRVQSPAYRAILQGFAEFDLDTNGFLDGDEIDFAARKDHDLEELSLNKRAQFEIKRLAHDGKNDARGISGKDALEFGRQELARQHAENDPQELKQAAEFLSKYYDRLNRSKDGLLSKADLSDLIEDPGLKFHFRQKFLLSERYFNAISELNREKVLKANEHKGISRKDLQILIANQGRIPRR